MVMLLYPHVLILRLKCNVNPGLSHLQMQVDDLSPTQRLHHIQQLGMLLFANRSFASEYYGKTTFS